MFYDPFENRVNVSYNVMLGQFWRFRINYIAQLVFRAVFINMK